MIPFSEILPRWGIELPSGAVALAVLLAGWLLALAARFVVTRGLRLLRFDRVGGSGLAAFLRKGRVDAPPSLLAGRAAFWLVLLATLLQAAFVLDVGLVTALAASLASVLPDVAGAGLVAAMGWAVVSFLANFTLTLARNASWPQAGLLARGVRGLGFILVAALAAEQLGLHIAVFSSLFLIVVGAVCLGLALAFGLGCQDLARDAMKRFLSRVREQDPPRGPDLEG